MDAVRIAVFAGGSIVLAWISRRSLSRPRSHGFPRFLTWECILALALVQSRIWFDHPTSLEQILSWIMLALSLIPLAAGVRALRRGGGRTGTRGDSSLYEWERTARLVTAGIYRYIRHPLYASLLTFAWGMYFKDISIDTTLLTAAATICLEWAAHAEERENLAYFGDAYAEYMLTTQRFIPFIW